MPTTGFESFTDRPQASKAALNRAILEQFRRRMADGEKPEEIAADLHIRTRWQTERYAAAAR